MDSVSSLQAKYNENASGYNQFLTIPLGKLEQQLFDLAITNCKGLKVLDLGTGTGARARDALKAGAEHVDAVDISEDMMRVGQEYEKSIERTRISWYQGDVSKSLDRLPLELESYDLVIANGIFDHAHNVEELDMMWRNCAAYLKPGGAVIANRNNPYSEAAKDGKYGVKLADFRSFDGGASFKYRMETDPPLVFDSIALDGYYSGSTDIPGKYFESFQNVAYEETPIVRAEPQFWTEYIDDPILFIFTAKKHK